jgi:hypothetical protein
MSARQSAELDYAFERNGWGPEDVKWLSQGSTLAAFLDVRRGTAKIVPLTPPILISVGTAKVAPTKLILTQSHYVVIDPSTGRIVSEKYYAGDQFKAWFVNDKERTCGGSTLAYAKLSRSSVDEPIVKELGGETKAETSLPELFALIAAQKNGGSGPLLTDGRANIFYVRDLQGVLRAVFARWYGGEWSVLAHSVTHPGAWNVGARVFSRNS